MYATPYVDPSEHTVNIDGTDYHSEITDTDRVSTFTGLDEYDTLFAAIHGRGALDPVPRVSEQLITTTSSGIPPPITGPELINPMESDDCSWYCTLKPARTGITSKWDCTTMSSLT